MEENKTVTKERIESFLNGNNPMERVITIETEYNLPYAAVIFVTKDGTKRIKKMDFKPFVWAKHSAAIRLFGGDKKTLVNEMRKCGIWVKALDTTSIYGKCDRIENGYKYMFYATKAMSYSTFMNFFKNGGVPLYPKKDEEDTKEYLKVTPTEQFMIANGIRLFKGYDYYGDLKRLIFDLETQGLNPRVHAIEQIGIRTNKGVERVISIVGETEEERRKNELNGIIEFIKVIAKEKPDIIVGHNSENFDWNFIIERCEVLGTSLEEISNEYLGYPIYKKKKETVLKLGGEVEYFYPTVIWGHIILDSLHAARRAQAGDSNMKSSNLKYVTKYLNMKKENRVYVSGDKISKTWGDTSDSYALNNTNGDWYEITDSTPLKEGYDVVSGRYIVERYLLDDLWETDKIEEKLNETNFLIGKWLPTTFQRAATMGTAGIWKLIMLAWSYENGLAVPALGKNRRFVGGLSRLIYTGYVDRIVKLDFNSLYPATILTWNIPNSVDGSGILNKLLEYVLTTREHYKGLKKEYGKKADEVKERMKKFISNVKESEKLKGELQQWKAEASLADKKQSQVKTLANSYFGSAGSPGLFPWGDDLAAERTTCLGRQQLRLMISHFKSIGYNPIVGDSVTYDTPIFVRDSDGLIDIIPICEAFNDSESVDCGNEQYRDFSRKNYQVLTRNGWHDIEYVYKHKTHKELRRIETKNGLVDCTVDHSLFDGNGNEVKPSELKRGDSIEIMTNGLEYTVKEEISEDEAWEYGSYMADNSGKQLPNIFYTSYGYKRVPKAILNSNKFVKKAFLDGFYSVLDEQNGVIGEYIEFGEKSKVAMGGLNFLMKEVGYNFDRHENEVLNNTEVISKSEYVYDISADGTFITALGMICCHNTDGFNFQMPMEFRYTDEHPYISNGKGRNSKEGKAYTNVEADVAEFEDMYFNQAWNGGINKSGLGIDEYCDACIQFGRKNYADLMPDGSVKKVGNTIKSRKMSGYLEKFIDDGVVLLLHGKGNEFIESYYAYVEKIFNYQIPLKDIASKGNIKKSVKEYIEDCSKVTKSGSKKSRQAWYELVIREGLNVNLGDTIYYINTGTKRSHADVKRTTRFYVPSTETEGRKRDVTREVELKYLEEYKNSGVNRGYVAKLMFGDSVTEEDEITLFCKLVPQEIMDKEGDVMCDEYEGLEYNVDKYIDMFNKRVKPLLVCFSKDVREKILVTNPKDRKYFTDSETKLVCGVPNKEEDQDTYESLMTPEQKEIEFWETVKEEPPFVKECGIDWKNLVKGYYDTKKLQDDLLFKEENEKYLEALSNLKDSDIEEFEDTCKVPKSLEKLVTLGSDMRFYFKKLPSMTPSTGGYIFDDLSKSYIETVEG